MKYNLITLILVCLVMSSCKNTEPSGAHDDCQIEHAGADAHSTEPEAEAEKVTFYSNKYELYLEYTPLVKGEVGTFMAHLTNLETSTPVKSGKLTVSAIKGESGVRNSSETPIQPGIFEVTLQPKYSGDNTIIIDYIADNENVKFKLTEVEVFADAHDILNAHEGHDHATAKINFTKEEQWKLDVSTLLATPQNFSTVINASGEIKSAQGEKRTIVARNSGVVRFANSILTQGQQVNKNTSLFMITSNNIAANNIKVKYEEAKNNFNRSKEEYRRNNALAEDGIVSDEVVSKSKAEYLSHKVIYESLAENYSARGLQIKSPISGFIQKVLVNEGDYVEAGTSLAVIYNNEKLMLQIDVPQNYFTQLNEISSVNFSPSYTNKVYKSTDLNGKYLSHGNSIDGNSLFIPLYFEIENNSELLEGAFIDAYIKTKEQANQIAIPKTAFVEEQGTFYVFVQKSGEGFEKRLVKLGGSDGINTQIVSGLKANERVVISSVMAIKMASLSAALPVHKH